MSESIGERQGDSSITSMHKAGRPCFRTVPGFAGLVWYRLDDERVEGRAADGDGDNKRDRPFGDDTHDITPGRMRVEGEVASGLRL